MAASDSRSAVGHASMGFAVLADRALADMIEIPLRIESLNKGGGREHWTMRSRRVSREREIVGWLLKSAPPQSACLPKVVKLTRIAPRMLDDDNNIGGLKSVRDAVADWLKINDNDPRVRWEYAQERGKPKVYAVRIEFA